MARSTHDRKSSMLSSIRSRELLEVQKEIKVRG